MYTYEYDLMGNRTAVYKKDSKGKVVESEEYSYNKSNQVEKVALYDGKKNTTITYSYDKDGNRISEIGKIGTDKVEKYYEYTVENRLAAVYDKDELLVAMAYDGDGNRVFQLNYNLHTDEDWKGNSGNGNGNNKDNKGSGNNGKGSSNNGKGNSKSTGTDDAGYGNATNAEEHNSQNQSGILFLIDEEVSETEQSLIDQIKTTGKEKNYELIEYLNDVNREYVEVLVEQNINGKTDTSYVYGVNRLSLDRFDGSTSYYLYDPRGSVVGITNEEGQIYQSYRYSATGEITFGAPQYENEYTYNGESYNPNIESQYLRARYYCVVTATFLTEDSYLGNINEPLTLNRYNYCVSSYLNYQDPSGNEVTPKEYFEIIEYYGKLSGREKAKRNIYTPNEMIRFMYMLDRVGSDNANVDYVTAYDYRKNNYLREVSMQVMLMIREIECQKKEKERGREVIIPEIVSGIFNGEPIELYPKKNWGVIGGGAYDKGVQKDDEGRYLVAVGPKILDPDYPDEGKIWREDFDNLSRYLEVTLKNKENGEIKIIDCYVDDFKAHSYNDYPAGQKYDTGDVAHIDVENGLIQTGIAYPNSYNARLNLACSREHMTGNVIEFAGSKLDFRISDYTLEKIIVLTKP